MANSVKITQAFDILTATGESHRVQEHTRCSTVVISGVKHQHLGRVFYKTVEGRGVLKNSDNNTYAIPSLDIKSARRQDS